MSMSISSSTDLVRTDVARDPAVQKPLVPSDSKAGGAPAQQQMKSDSAARLVEEIQKKIDSINVGLSFSTYGKNHQIAIKVVERDTGEIIREIPPEELQQLADKLDEMIGLIFSKSA